MISRALLLTVLFFSSSLIVRGDELVDPLRGLSFERILQDKGDVFLVRIDSARRGFEPGFCQYDYTASVLRVYKEQGRTRKSTVAFSSASRFRVDDDMLIVMNNNSKKLGPRDQARCKVKIAQRLGANAFLLREDEALQVFNVKGRYFALLPYRRFWSSQPIVFSRQGSRPDERYAMLQFADGRLDGDFIALDDLLKSIADQSRRPSS